MLKRLTPYLVLVQLVLVVVLLFQVNSLSTITGDSIAIPDLGGDVKDTGSVVDVSIDGDAVLYGDPDSAKVVIVEYSDFQCPFCRKAWPTLQALEAKYGDDIAIVYKNFPLGFHPAAQVSAEAAACADEQGLFPKMHDLLYGKQAETGSSGTVEYTVDDIKEWAKDLEGLDYDAWVTCLDDGATTGLVQKNYNEGVADGVRGTPAFFVNGVLISGAQPQSVFEAE